MLDLFVLKVTVCVLISHMGPCTVRTALYMDHTQRAQFIMVRCPKHDRDRDNCLKSHTHFMFEKEICRVCMRERASGTPSCNMKMLPKNNSSTSVFYNKATCFSNLPLYGPLYLEISEFLKNFQQNNYRES